MKKYVICPGTVQSRTDGDVHYVSSRQLAQLYRLRPHEYYIALRDTPDHHVRNWQRAGLTFLHPRRDGNYELPDREAGR